MRIFLFLLSLLFVLPAYAHEFWLEPKAYIFPKDATLTAGLYNGQKFKGGELAFVPKTLSRFDLALGERIEPVQGRLGDQPALNMAPMGEGLHAALYESAGDTVHYRDFAGFTRFAAHKDFLWALEKHVQRGLPDKAFNEFYTRHVKALLASGNGAGQDRMYGLATEFVALKNPYVDDVSGGLPVRVLYKGEPRVRAQVELFNKEADGRVTTSFHWTDAEGIALLPVVKGHSYLADAVVIREPEPGSKAAESKAVWETLWAALTFAVPG
jgi:uncharacterized GH25 family protein